MIYQRINLNDLISAVETQVKERTGVECSSQIRETAGEPYYYIQVVKTQTTGSKTSYCETITVWIYAVCPSNDQHEKNNMLNALNEALTEDIELPQPYILVMQKDSGRQQTDQKENDKREAMEAYDFVVSYGLKFKED
ncbi:DUF5072 domain-containing protein [Casaltella massiliensis]|mgnify:CR=1 FL=1|nr:DUF5072 domain-containing protein [Casaltella massiliensis]